MGVTYWQILAGLWLASGMVTLYLMDRAEKQAGGGGRFTPLNFANLATIVAVLLFWPLALLADIIARRRQAQGKDANGAIWKIVLVMVIPFVILLLPVFLVALVIGFVRRRLRGAPAMPEIDPDSLLRLAPWPGPAEERALLARWAGVPDPQNPPPMAELRNTPAARLMETAWLYVGLRVARIDENEALALLEEARGATHDAHPRDLRSYLAWRQQQDDPGGPAIEAARFATVASDAVNWACDWYRDHAAAEMAPPEMLIALEDGEPIAPRRIQNMLARLILAEGDAVWRCVEEEGGAHGVLLIRDGEAFAHLSY